MPAKTKAELLAENERLQKRVAALERAKARSEAASKEIRKLRADLLESERQQTATAEILRIISSSPTDTQPVFDAIASSAIRLFQGASVGLRLLNGDRLERVGFAMSPDSKVIDDSLQEPRPLDDHGIAARAVLRRELIQTADVFKESWPSEETRDLARRMGWRACAAAPLLREDKALGAIIVNRSEPSAFNPKEIELLKTFADQAVIAIENVRLFNETKQALEQQTAVSEILRVISRSPTDVQPVFDAIVKSGVHLFGGMNVTLRLVKGNRIESVASTNPLYHVGGELPDPLDDEGMPGARAIRRREVVQIPDYVTAEEWVSPRARQRAEKRGFRALMSAPMLRDITAIGTINVIRATPGPFSDKQAALLQTFADQAVIAIENVRLFKELQARNADVTEALEQETATSEILRVISNSPTDTQPVLDAIAESAARLCDANDVVIRRADGDVLRVAAHFGSVPVTRPTLDISRESPAGRAVLEQQTIHIHDVGEERVRAEYSARPTLYRHWRTLVVVPLLRENTSIGTIALRRPEVQPFSDKQIKLLETFAAQAVIAIENVRLFHEIAEKGRQLEVASRHKSDFLASMSHELRTPLNAILGFIELILDQIYGEVPGDLQEPLADIQASGKHLLRLINNVLDLAKIEAGRMELALAEYSVQDTVESVRQTLKPLAAEKGLEFLVTVPPDLPFAHGDPGRITQCLMNLAGNSLKFTKAGKVEISVEQQGERLVFRVADTGIGIAPDKITSLFTEFKQTDATIAGEYGGTGLGLSISRKFVEMHGGRIWVESELGSGSTFVFELPLRAGEPT